MPKVESYFPDPTGGTVDVQQLIFGEYAVKYADVATWLEGFAANTLDIDYLLARSGEKWASPFLEKLATIAADPVRDLPNRWLAERIADQLHNRYTDSWNRLYAVLTAEYNPLHNYDMDETTTHGHVVTDSGSDSTQYGRTSTDSGTDQLAHGHVVTDSGDEMTTFGHQVDSTSRSDAVEQNNIYGFNTSAPVTPTASVGVSTSGGTDTFTTTDNRGVPSTASLGGNTGVGNETHSGSDTIDFGKIETHSGTDATTYGKKNTMGGTDTVNYGKAETHSGQDVLHREGNIGVTTSQQMILSEIPLRDRNHFLEVVFSNVDELLALSIY